MNKLTRKFVLIVAAHDLNLLQLLKKEESIRKKKIRCYGHWCVCMFI